MEGEAMRKQQITREMVVDAAFEIARRGGMEAVLVKDVAQALKCSVQPIYSYCGSMEGLRQAVEERAAEFVREYVTRRREAGAAFRSTGLAYLRLAQEEPQLYRIFFSRRQEEVHSLEDLYSREADPKRAAVLAEELGLREAAAKELHLHMILYNMGLGFLLAAGAELKEDEAAAQLEKAYRAFLRQAREETV